MQFDAISKKVLAGERLSRDEGIFLLRDADLLLVCLDVELDARDDARQRRDADLASAHLDLSLIHI